MKKPVQLYKYDADFYSYEENDEAYFLEQFNPSENLEVNYWLNFHSMNERAKIEALCDKIQIDKTLQESIFVPMKRVRIEEYANYVFFSIVSALPNHESTNFELNKDQISFIVGDNFLISFQEKSSDHFPVVRDKIIKKRGRIRYKSSDYLLFCMLDAIIDNYLEVVEEISAKIDRLDQLIIKTPNNELLRKVEWEKRTLLDLRKVVFPMKELLSQIIRVENKLIIEDNLQYFNGLKDTCASLIEEIEAQKQMLDGISNLYYAIQGQRMNQIMKVLTVTSAIFIPLTFIVGVYGMNFEYMPELKWKFGYLLTWSFMVTLSLVLVYVFWKRGWLKRDTD